MPELMTQDSAMFNGNLYGLIITLLTFVIAVVLTMRQVERSGVHLELIIRPVSVAKQGEPHSVKQPEQEMPQTAPGANQVAKSPEQVTR